MSIGASLHTFNDFIGTIALIALLSVAYGTAMRWCGNLRLARLLLGASFGGAAVLAMFDPLVVAPGVIADMRNIPIILAGAFLGREGLLVAASMATAMRLGIGGDGAWGGAVGLVLAGLLGLAWAQRLGSGPRSPRMLMALAALLPLHWVTILLLPPTVAWSFATTVLPHLIPVEMLGVLIVGALLERELRLMEGERRLAVDADRDLLTGLLNRRGFEREVNLLRTAVGSGALLLLDIDNFKRINDRHGHPGGDAVLRAIGGRLAPHLRPGQILARLGGEELALFLPGHSSQEARDLARHLCHAVRSDPFGLPGGGDVAVTVSVGGAWGSPAKLDILMERADAALYAAKHAGRDRCLFASEGPVPAPDLPGGAPFSEGNCGGCHLQDACAAEGRTEVAASRLQARSA